MAWATSLPALRRAVASHGPLAAAAVAWWSLLASPLGWWGPRGAAAQIHKCHDACKTCHLFDYDQSWHCVECEPGYELWVDGCFQACNTGQYRYGYECRTCTYNCDECVGSHRHECTQCSPGYDFDFRQLCVKQCDPGWYSVLDGRSCDQCDAYCKTCIAKFRVSCLDCFEGYTLRIHEENTSTGECLAFCDEGWYREASDDNRCIQCGQYCEQCVKVDKCTRCQNNATLYRGLCYLLPSFAADTQIDFEAYMSSGATTINFSDPKKPKWEDLFERRLRRSDSPSSTRTDGGGHSGSGASRHGTAGSTDDTCTAGSGGDCGT